MTACHKNGANYRSRQALDDTNYEAGTESKMGSLSTKELFSKMKIKANMDMKM